MKEIFVTYIQDQNFKFCDDFRDAFVNYWINSNMMTMDVATQIFTILKKPNLDHLTKVSSPLLYQ
jgi:hypothetical protein